MRPDKVARLRELLLEFSYQKRVVQLASGRTSDFYFDGKQTSLHPEGANLIGEWMLEKIRGEFAEARAVGGPTLGADPIATAVSVLSFQRHHPLFAFIVRKEPKGHGTMNWIEGARHLKPGMRVVLVEDVITTGGAVRDATRALREAGAVVETVVCAIDRSPGSENPLSDVGLEVRAVLTKDQLDRVRAGA